MICIYLHSLRSQQLNLITMKPMIFAGNVSEAGAHEADDTILYYTILYYTIIYYTMIYYDIL